MMRRTVPGRHGAGRAAQMAPRATMVLALVVFAGACKMSGAVNPDPVSVSPGQTSAYVSVSWEGAFPLADIFIDLCKRPVDAPGFDLAADCDPGSSVREFGSIHGRGTAEVDVFVGATRDHDGTGGSPWACVPEGEEPPDGLEGYSPCFVRITWGDRANAHGATSSPYRFVRDGAEIPEAPWTLLPLAVGALGAGWWGWRRMRPQFTLRSRPSQ